MHRIKVNLITQTDIKDFVGIATTIPIPVYLEDGTTYRVNAKSLIGVMYGSIEFNHLYVMSEYEHLETKFNRFLV